MTPRQIALVVSATAGVVFFAVVLLAGRGDLGPTGLDLAGPVGTVIMGGFATACAAGAAKASHRGQRLSWIVVAIGLGGWTVGNAVWLYVAAGGRAPIANSSVAELGYVVLPLFALAAALLVPSRDDARYGIGLLLDGVLVAASLLEAMGTLTLGATDSVDFPRIVLAVVTVSYLALFVMVLMVVRQAEPVRRLSPALMSAGFAAIGVAGAMHVFGKIRMRFPMASSPSAGSAERTSSRCRRSPPARVPTSRAVWHDHRRGCRSCCHTCH